MSGVGQKVLTKNFIFVKVDETLKPHLVLKGQT